ncbi:rhodanese-like domain-containing protein [Winogradskyella sp.]|uniref:rhodanese-like domain-containing protein n=1 Tax=Winogradskyella sp. TaxID=1883156 RepID=UPI00260E1E81|nr:rhodanese-like domain-containing protein [Winogradskyella sp.]
MTLLKIFGSQTKETNNIKILTSEEFKSAINEKDIQLIDVRTSREYNSGHIEKAVNIDFFNRLTFVDALKKLDKSRPVFLYCHSGNRSQKAAKMILEMGFQEIYDLRGGYSSWS